jgi:hypothetical protein
MKFLFGFVSVVLILASCATEPLVKPTRSGYPEGIFLNATLEEVQSKIVEGCSSRGIFVMESTKNVVICGKTLEGRDAVLGSLLVGGRYSTTPELKIRFILYQKGNDVYVTAQQWIESQSGFGQIRREELKHNRHINDIQKFLFSLGAQ